LPDLLAVHPLLHGRRQRSVLPGLMSMHRVAEALGLPLAALMLNARL
jgi:hypothetical protein